MILPYPHHNLKVQDNLQQAFLYSASVLNKYPQQIIILQFGREMCRMVGYLGGIVVFLVLGVKQIKGYGFFYATAIINLICIVLVIIFRILAKNFNGFWRVWSKRLQKQIRLALACLSQYTEMPQYDITTVTVDPYGNKSVSTSTTINTFLWGCVECVACAILTVISPIILAFLIFCYIQSMIYECRWRQEQKAKLQIKEDEIARQSARMTLGVPLRNHSAEFRQEHVASYVPTYPMMQSTYVNQTYVKTVFIAGPYPPPPNVQNNNEQMKIMVNQQIPEKDLTQNQQQRTQISAALAKEQGQSSNIQEQNIRNDQL